MLIVEPEESVAVTVIVEVGLREIGFCKLLMRKENYDPEATSSKSSSASASRAAAIF